MALDYSIINKSKEDILGQVKREFEQSRRVVQNKRITFRDRLKLYKEDNKNKEKVSVNLCYSNIRALIALSVTDELQVTFNGRDYSDATRANLWTKMAKFDKEEMGLDEINLAGAFNRFFYGIDIRVFDDYNKNTQSPVIYTANPMMRLPDPVGRLTAEKFRRSGFISKMTKFDMSASGFENIDSFNKNADKEFFDRNPYNQLAANNETTEEPYKYVYNHYTKFDGRKFLITTNYDMSDIGRIVPIDSILQSETEETLRPWSLTYYNPEEFNPYGGSVMDITEDKQRVLSKLLNLAVKRSIRSSVGGTRVYNKMKIPNRSALANLTEDPKIIGVDLKQGETLDNIIKEIEMSQLPNDNNNVSEQIQYFSKLATSLDPVTVGISAPGTQTATETQQMQANANVILGLSNYIDFLGEKDFWRKRMKMIKQNLSGKKVIRITNGLGTKTMFIRKGDIKTKYDPDITISSRNEENAKNAKTSQMVTAMIGTLPEGYGKTYALRKMFILNGMDEDEASVFVPETSEEIQAKQQLELLNRNIDVGPVTDIMEDHDAYIAIFRQGQDTPAKDRAMQARLMAKVEKDKQMRNQGQDTPAKDKSTSNTSQSMLMANALQKDKAITTTADVKQ